MMTIQPNPRISCIAQEYLRKLRQELADIPQHVISAPALEEVQERYPEVASQLTESLVSLTLDDLLQGTADSLLASLSPNELARVKGKVALGELPTYNINATAIRVPRSNDAYVVLFNHGLSFYMHEMIKVFGAALQVTKHGNQDGIGCRFGKSDEALISRGGLLVKAFLSNKDPTTVGPFVVPKIKERFEIIGGLLIAAQTFVVAHELSHILLGHLSSCESEVMAVGSLQAEACIPDWEAEFEADELALEIMNRPATQHGVAFYESQVWLSGPFLALSMLNCLTRASALLSGLEEDLGTKTHPPVVSRLARLRNLITSFEESLPLAHLGSHFYEVLWHYLRPEFTKS